MRKTIMLTCCMLLIGLLIPNLLQAQEEPVINFSKSRLTLSGALSAVEQQSGYSIAYNENLLDLKKVVTAPSGKRLSQVLASLLEGTNCEARIKDKIILIVKKEKGAVKVYSGKVRIKMALSSAPLFRWKVCRLSPCPTTTAPFPFRLSKAMSFL